LTFAGKLDVPLFFEILHNPEKAFASVSLGQYVPIFVPFQMFPFYQIV